jgi:hypothetical protein
MKRYFPFIILGLFILNFSRVFESVLGLPSIINFLHFGVFIPLFLYSIIRDMKSYNSYNKKLLLFMFIFFFSLSISAILNFGGIINIFLEYFLLVEPFMLLILITNAEYSRKTNKALGRWLIFFGLINLPFVLYQWYNFRHISPDMVDGTLIGMGAGAHVLGAIAIIAGIVLLFSKLKISLFYKIFFSICLFAIPIINDSKQAIVVFIAAFFILTLIKMRKFSYFVKYSAVLIFVLVIISILVSIFYPNLYFFNSGVLSEGLQAKMSVFSILNSHHESVFGWLFGFGPGHTVSRLAYMLYSTYGHWLAPFGATTSHLTEIIWNIQESNYLTNSITGSSFFSLFFSWAGIVGDAGIIGLLIYIAGLYLVYTKFCLDDVSKLIFFAIIIFGFVFGWLEEPNFMLYSFAVIAYRWNLYKNKWVHY